MDALAGQFGVLASGAAAEQVLIPGKEFSVRFADKPVFHGFIERTECVLTARDFSVNASGRSPAADLIDCALPEIPTVFRNIPLGTLIGLLVKPFNIRYRPNSVLAAQSVREFHYVFGETVASALGRLMRLYNFRLTSFADGSVGHFVSDGKGARVRLTEHAPLIECTILRDESFVRSPIVLRQNNGWEESVVQRVHTITGENRRYRPLCIETEEKLLSGEARALWEYTRRQARAESLALRLAGWCGEHGLWNLGDRIAFSLPLHQKLDEKIVSSVNFHGGKDGFFCALECVPPSVLRHRSASLKASLLNG